MSDARDVIATIGGAVQDFCEHTGNVNGDPDDGMHCDDCRKVRDAILSALNSAGLKVLADTTHAERSWSEDRDHENGNYSCSCVICLREFTGHKRRALCFACDAAPPKDENARKNCGNCAKWMKSRECPSEKNVNGRQVGPSCNSLPCKFFTSSSGHIEALASYATAASQPAGEA